MADLLRRFHGELRLVVAAYYCGSRPLDRRGLAYRNPDVVEYVEAVRRRYERHLREEQFRRTSAFSRRPVMRRFICFDHCAVSLGDGELRPAIQSGAAKRRRGEAGDQCSSLVGQHSDGPSSATDVQNHYQAPGALATNGDPWRRVTPGSATAGRVLESAVPVHRS
jgi:hypothetical protein